MEDTVIIYWCPVCKQPFKENRSHHSWPIQRVICKGTLVARALIEPKRLETMLTTIDHQCYKCGSTYQVTVDSNMRPKNDQYGPCPYCGRYEAISWRDAKTGAPCPPT